MSEAKCAVCARAFKNAAGLAIHNRKCKAEVRRSPPAALLALRGTEPDSDDETNPANPTCSAAAPAAAKPAPKKRGKVTAALGDIQEPGEIKCDDSQANIILALVNKCHNVMRDQQAITGMIAYQDIIKLLFLRFMEPELSGKLAHLLNPAQYENITDIFDEPFKPSDVQLLRFSVLRNPKIGGLGEAFKRSIYITWDMLSKNSYTKNIFEAGDRFTCNMTTLYICLEEIGLALEKVNFDKLPTDIKGDIYEHFVNGYADHKGKDFGQFFTPRKMIKLIFNLNAYLFPDFKPSNIYDPCAGTGGFLTEMHKICKCPLENIHGGEIERSTFASLVMNLLLSTGSICDVEQRNSFVFTKKEQYDWIGTNPPFGTEVDYEKILVLPPPVTDFTKKELYPCEVNDGSALFLQSCARRLKPGGVCNIVLPYGEIFFGKRKVFQKLREYMILNYDIHAVLIAPIGVFTHTKTATAVMYFTTGKTSAITFYETDLTCKEFKETKRLTLTEIADNQYNLLLKSYDAKIKLTLIDSTWSIKKLGDICELRGGTAITRAELTPGDYPVIASGTKPSGMHNKYNREPNTILCASSGMAGIISMYNQKIWASDCFSIHPNKTILNQYLFYYLKSRQDDIYKFQHGSNHKHVNMSDMETFEIPICSLERQQEIITRYESYDAEIKQCNERIKLIENEKKIIASNALRLFISQ